MAIDGADGWYSTDKNDDGERDEELSHGFLGCLSSPASVEPLGPVNAFSPYLSKCALHALSQLL